MLSAAAETFGVGGISGGSGGTGAWIGCGAGGAGLPLCAEAIAQHASAPYTSAMPRPADRANALALIAISMDGD